MGVFEMVLGIVIVVTIGNVLRGPRGMKRLHRQALDMSDATSAENQQLRGEIGSLKERIAVLERVVTDNEGSLRLDREIEKLRDARHD